MSNSSILDNTKVIAELKDFFQNKVPPYPPIVPYDSFYSFQYSLPSPITLTGQPGGSGVITLPAIPVKKDSVIYMVGEINAVQVNPNWVPMVYYVFLKNSSGVVVYQFPNPQMQGGWADPGSSNNSGDTVFGGFTVTVDDSYYWEIGIQASVYSTAQTINAGGTTNFNIVRIPAYANF